MIPYRTKTFIGINVHGIRYIILPLSWSNEGVGCSFLARGLGLGDAVGTSPAWCLTDALGLGVGLADGLGATDKAGILDDIGSRDGGGLDVTE